MIRVKLIFGREPAVLFGLAANLLMAVGLLLPWSVEVHGAVNAAILAAAGVATALYVSVDAVVPAVVGLSKAVLALVLAFGVDVSEGTQVAILAVVTAGLAFLVRSSVEAKVGPGWVEWK